MINKLLFTATLLISSSLYAAATITFTENPSVAPLAPVTTQYSTYGITATNVYLYKDARDTFDQYGVAALIDTAVHGAVPNNPGVVFFTNPANNLSIDYLVIQGHPGTFSVFDNANALLDSFTIPSSTADLVGTYLFNASGIARLEFSGEPTYDAISTLRFDAVATTTSVPEPANSALLGIALVCLGASLRAGRCSWASINPALRQLLPPQ